MTEPLAWSFSLATKRRGDGTYCEFRRRLSFTKPCVPEESIRDLTPLIPVSTLIELNAKIERYEAALNRLASWDEGEEVTGSFDEPSSARVAREALGGKK